MNKRVYLALFLVVVLSPALHAGWSEMQRLTYRGNEDSPQVVARNDTVHIICEQAAGAISYLRSTDNGETWSDIIDINEPGHFGNNACFAIDSNSLWVSWMDNNSESIAITSSTNGEFWGRPIYKYTIDSQRWGGLCMAIKYDSIFIAYLATTPDSTGLLPYKFLQSPDGGHSWSNLFTINHLIQNGSVQRQLLNYCNGILLFISATQVDSLGEGPHIVGYLSYNNGIQWSAPILISPAQWHYAQWPCVSCNWLYGLPLSTIRFLWRYFYRFLRFRITLVSIGSTGH
jgi:hypothetical protein